MAPGLPRSLAAAALVVGLFGAGLAVGRSRPVLPAGPSGEIRGLVRDLGREIAAGRVDAVWDRLAPSTRALLESSHAALLRGVAGYEARRATDPAAEQALRLLEREYGMDAAALARTSPRDLWVSRTRARLGPPREVEAFATLRIDRAECDGGRARVWAVLPDGRPQGLHAELVEGRWRLVDFVPYGEIGKMERPVARGPAGGR